MIDLSRLAAIWTSKFSPRFSASWRNGRAMLSSRPVNTISSASTDTVPDSILERSRMSEIRFSRSVPAPWMVRANSTCLSDRLPSGLSCNCWPRIRIELSGVRSSWLMLARNSDLYLEVRASSVALSSRARRACSISWFLASTSTFRSASCWAFCSSCSLVCCSSCCWVCSSAASCWLWVSRPSVCMVASMELSTMPMPAVSCSRKPICRSVKGDRAASSITALTSPSNSTGSTTALVGWALNRPERIGVMFGGRSLSARRRPSRAHWPIRPSPSCSRGGWPSVGWSA